MKGEIHTGPFVRLPSHLSDGHFPPRLDTKRKRRGKTYCRANEWFVFPHSWVQLHTVYLNWPCAYSSPTGRQLFERGTQMEDASLFEEGTESVDVSMFDRSERDDAREREEETARVHLSDSD
jgi:hypothetical protein